VRRRVEEVFRGREMDKCRLEGRDMGREGVEMVEGVTR
jgi:hypothetical protein